MSETDGVGEKTDPSAHHKPILRVKHPSGTEDVHYSLTYEGFPDEFQAMAERELKETPDARKRGLQRLKEYMTRHGMPPLKDELLLLASLRNCKYNLKKSEAKLKNFLNARQEIIEMLKELGMEKIELILDDMGFGMLPYRDKCGRVIFYTRPNGLKSDLYDVDDVGLVFAAGGLFSLSFPITSAAGFAYFGECESNSLYIFYPIFKAFKRCMFVMFSLPIRVARVEILNENSLCRCFHGFITPFVGKKILSRVSLHGSNFEQFHRMYDPDILPEDFGGNMGPLSNEAYRQKLLDFIRDLIND